MAAVAAAYALTAAGDRVTFTDVTTAAGIRFTHNSGRSDRRYLPETLGSGVAIVDVDGDGWLDIVFVNGKDWQPRGTHSTAALYRNNGNGGHGGHGGFTDITRG